MTSHQRDAVRLADLLAEAETNSTSHFGTAKRLLAAGVTLPTEPPKWEPATEHPHLVTFGHEDGDPAWSGRWYIGTFREGGGTPARAKRLADHLNATGFTPEDE